PRAEDRARVAGGGTRGLQRDHRREALRLHFGGLGDVRRRVDELRLRQVAEVIEQDRAGGDALRADVLGGAREDHAGGREAVERLEPGRRRRAAAVGGGVEGAVRQRAGRERREAAAGYAARRDRPRIAQQ